MTVVIAILVLIGFAIYLFYAFQEQPLGSAQRKPLRGEHGDGYKDTEFAEDYSFESFRTREENDYLPESYGEDRLVLMAKDPDWLYAYWEITDASRKTFAKETNEEAWQSSQPVLRVYDQTAGNHFDININDDSNNWYVMIRKPNSKFRAEIGRVYEGKYYTLIQSNQIVTPAYDVSNEIDPRWSPISEIWHSLEGAYNPAFGSNHLCKDKH